MDEGRPVINEGINLMKQKQAQDQLKIWLSDSFKKKILIFHAANNHQSLLISMARFFSPKTGGKLRVIF